MNDDTEHYHRLLRRQMKRFFVDGGPHDPVVADFLKSVNQAYLEFESDIAHSENIMEQSSRELVRANRELERIAKDQTVKANEALRRLGEVVDSISEALIQLDRSGCIVYLSTAWEKLTGYSVEKCLGMRFGSQLLDAHDRHDWEELMQGSRAELKRVIHFERGDGQRRYCQLSLQARFEADGTLTGFSGTLADLHDQYLAQLELSRLGLVVEKTKNIVVITDTEARISWVNQAFVDITGYSREEVYGRKPGSFLQGPDTDRSMTATMREHFNRQESFHGEILNYNKQGKPYWLEVFIDPVFDDQGTHLGFIAVENEITERRKQDDRIRQLVVWLDESSEAVQVAREDGVLVFLNKESCRRLGRSAEELVGQHVSMTEAIFEQAGIWEAHVQELREKGRLLLQGMHKRADGTTFPVEASVKYHEQEGVGYVLAFISDISDRVDNERKLAAYTRELEASIKELDQFAYVVSHDLKSPLRAINNLSEWIEEDLDAHLKDETRRNFELLRGRVMRLEKLIDGILAYSRAGRSRATLENVTLPDFVEDVFADFQHETGVELKCNGPQLTLFTEKLALFQVISNLVSNGIKHGDKDHKRVDVRWQHDGTDRLAFEVSDNGPGIDPLYHERIFRIFQTLQARDVKDSTGVGLSIVKKIVEEKGGSILLDSKVGAGSRFLFSWPLRERSFAESLTSGR